MTSALRSEALAALREDRAHAAILFDLDGTLAPIAAQPSDARVPESTRHLLIAVARRYPVVACVTGRRASEARAMVSIGTITYLGSHGAELLRAGWTEAVLDPTLAEWARRIHEFGYEHDVTDLDAFRSLCDLVEEGRLRRAVRVGGSSDEGPEEITAEADVVVEGTSGVRELLELLVAG